MRLKICVYYEVGFMKKVFELPVAEILELSSDEIMDVISGDNVDYSIIGEEEPSAVDNF